MLAVRCDACGMKALVAASQCPHCAHPLDIRDSFGEIVPLVHCPTCDASYRRSDGACRWCGTTPERANLRPFLWKGVGVVAFAGMAVGVWFTRDVVEPEKRQVQLANVPAAAPSPNPDLPDDPPVQPTTSQAPVAGSDQSVATDSALGPVASDSAVTRALAAAVVVETLYLPAPPPQPSEAGGSAGPESESSSSANSARSSVARTPSRPTPRRPTRWTTAVVTSWAIVRAGPSRTSRLLGSIGPDSRVQIGEVRGDWRRVQMRGLAGWVENGRFTTRRLASQRSGKR